MRDAVPEDESVDCLTLALFLQQLGEEVGEGHAPRLVALGRARNDLARDVHRVLSDENTTADKVEAVCPEPDRFTPADAGLGEREHERAVRPGLLREILNLVMGEDAASAPDRLNVNAPRGVEHTRTA